MRAWEEVAIRNKGRLCSDIDILGTRCKKNRVACWSLELCYLQGCRRGE